MDSLVGTVVANRFQVLRLLGRGGMGKVYEVELTQLKKRFAMKVLAKQLAGQEDALRRFRREAEIVASLNHPNIIEIVDWATADDGRPLYVMELLEGMDLEERIKANGPLPWSEIATVAAQSVSALLEAHGKGILHRDLKPTNVFITETGPSLRVKLIDFGLAKARDLASITMYTCPKLIGTPAYMSPQQLQGESSVGEEADCWAMAAVLYEAATARRAFKGGYAELIYLIGKTSPAPIGHFRPDAPAAFADAIAAALTPDESRRITSLEELGDRVANALVGQGGGAVKASLRSLARATEDRQQGLPDTLPWGATLEDAEPAGMTVGKKASSEGGASKANDARHVDTLPWGTPGISPEPERQEPEPLDQGVAQRQRSTQRLTKPDRPAQPGESISAEPAIPTPAGRSKPQGSAEHFTQPSRPTNAPPIDPNRSQIYALWTGLLVAIGLLVLVLLLQSGDSQQPSSDALSSNDPAPPKTIVTMDAGTNDTVGRTALATKPEDAGTIAGAPPEDAGTAEGTLNMEAEPGAATLQVFDNVSNELVFEGEAPKSLRIPVGQYRVLTEHKGYLSNMTIVEIRVDRAVSNKVVLLARSKTKSVNKPKQRSAPIDDKMFAPSF